jgi:hypothetical protein
MNICINLMFFLSCNEIQIFSHQSLTPGSQIVIVLAALFCFTILELIFCLLYRVEFYLAIQLKIVRFIIFPLGLNYLFGQITPGAGNVWLMVFLAIAATLVVYIISILFGSESFTDLSIHHSNLPISSAFIFIEVIFYSLQALYSEQGKILFSCIFLTQSLIIKSNCFVKESSNI